MAKMDKEKQGSDTGSFGQRVGESLGKAVDEKAWLLVSGTPGDGSWTMTRDAMGKGAYPMVSVSVQCGDGVAESLKKAGLQIEALVANPYKASVLVDLDGPVEREVAQAWMKGLEAIAGKGRMAAMVSKQALEGFDMGNARALLVGAPHVPPELSSAFKARLEKGRESSSPAAVFPKPAQ
jgi:hypothetical protein